MTAAFVVFSKKYLNMRLIKIYTNFLTNILCTTLFMQVIWGQTRQEASLIVHHATIYTVDKQFSTAQAMAIKNDKIVAIGNNKNILKKYKADKVIDAKGNTVLPGLIDAHCHFTGYATDQWKCDLTGTSSFDEVIQKILAYSKDAPTQWIYGRGWDQTDWEIKEFPNKAKLDELFPDRPVFLKRVDGHAVLVNQVALDIAGVTVNTVVSGGSIEQKSGQLTGILLDNAMDLVENKIPQISDSLAKRYMAQIQQTCFAAGLTGVHDCGISEHTVQLLKELQQEGVLKMKVYAFLSDSARYYDQWIKSGPYLSERLKVGGFKLYADGALGSRGACLLEDYTDKKNWKGFLLKDIPYYKSIVDRLAKSNLQLCTHAIGDSAIRTMLKLYADALKKKNDRRWRMEHAQVVNEKDFHFFGDYNIIPSVQPTHATSDMYWAEQRLGAIRIKNAYAYKKLLQQNGWLPLGTDFPVEDINPFKTFFAAVARKDSKNYPAGGFQMANALSRRQALQGMTIWAAKASFEEKEKGSLEVGKKADFIIIDKDIMQRPIPQAHGLNSGLAHVLATFINGEMVWSQ